MTRCIIAVLALMSIGAACCDPKHDAYAANARVIKLCEDRGGIPITTPITDQGEHTFQVLQQCAFPCDQRLPAER